MSRKATSLPPERKSLLETAERIRKADERLRASPWGGRMPTVEDVEWAEENKLPREFFEYFELQRVA